MITQERRKKMTGIHRQIEASFAALTDLTYRRRFLALSLMLLVTFALTSQLPKLRIDTGDETFFHKDDPALIAYNRFRDTYGQDDLFMIAMKPARGLTANFIADLRELHAELEETVPYIDDITSLVNARVVRAEGDTLIVGELLGAVANGGDEEIERALQLIERYPLYDKLLVSEDRSLTTILIKAQAAREEKAGDLLAGFAVDVDERGGAGSGYLSNEESVKITAAIHGVIDKYGDRGIEFHLAGTPAVMVELEKSIEHDLRVMVPGSLLLICFFLLLLFRRLSGVLYPLIIVSLSLLSSLGIMALADIPITNVIQILPSFLIIVGIGDSVHIQTIFYRNYRDTRDKRQAIVAAVGRAGLPVLMTSLTTACGVLSFAWADVASVAQLGYVAPAGVMLAFVYTVVLLPALIGIFPMKPGRPLPAGDPPLVDRLFDWISRVTTRRPLVVAGLFSVAVGAALFYASAVRFSHNVLTWFPPDSPIRAATELLEKKNGGSILLEVLIDTGRDNGLHDPDLQRRLSEAAAALPSIEARGIRSSKAWSIADVLKEINRALHEDQDEAYTVPESRELIAQELILFEASGSDDLSDFADSSWRTARLSILAPFEDAIVYRDYVDLVKEYLAGQFPGAVVTITGHVALFIRIIRNTITSMAKSYVFALLVITLLMILMIGRIRIGLMSMIANVVPIIGIMGIMGFMGIPLDLSTILVGSIVLGLVVDDTIHFLHHFRRAYAETPDVELAVRETFHSTGRALAITSMVLCGGFFINTAAYLASTVRYGILTGSAVIFALVADFFLVPALLTLVYKRKSALGSTPTPG